jgi:hypothetical protein
MSAFLAVVAPCSRTGAPWQVIVPSMLVASAFVKFAWHGAPMVVPAPATKAGEITDTAAAPPAIATAICVTPSELK